MTEVKVSWKGNEEKDSVPGTESDIWRCVGMTLLRVGDDVPCEMDVEVSGDMTGKAVLNIIRRGKFIKDGVEHPSMYVVPVYNGINVSSSEYQKAYLTCINPESNNYKFYEFIPNNTSGRTINVGARYGRIGSERGEAFGVKDLREPFDSYLYWIRYYEKLSKGYKDTSSIYLAKQAELKKAKPEDSSNNKEEKSAKKTTPESVELYSMLKAFANQVVQEVLQDPKVVTEAQIKESKKIWTKLGNYKTVKTFNKHLMELMAICPRKCRYVSEYLASSTDDFGRILDREEALINAMQIADDTSEVSKGEKESFADYDIGVFAPTEEQKKQVIGHLPAELQAKVRTVYRVIPKKQTELYEQYVKDHPSVKEKFYYHGSKNCNWGSIIINSLSLHPNAAITGKMLGNGIYFAPSAMKSWGYISAYGSYWAHGNSSTGIMGIYKVAEDSLDVTNNIRQYSPRELGTHNSVYAARGGYYGLRGDEMCLFDEHALCLQYILVFNC